MQNLLSNGATSAVYATETWGIANKDLQLLEVTELKMLLSLNGTTRTKSVSNACIRAASNVDPIAEVIQRRLQWCGHLMRREREIPHETLST